MRKIWGYRPSDANIYFQRSRQRVLARGPLSRVFLIILVTSARSLHAARRILLSSFGPDMGAI